VREKIRAVEPRNVAHSHIEKALERHPIERQAPVGQLQQTNSKAPYVRLHNVIWRLGHFLPFVNKGLRFRYRKAVGLLEDHFWRNPVWRSYHADYLSLFFYIQTKSKINYFCTGIRLTLQKHSRARGGRLNLLNFTLPSIANITFADLRSL